MTGRLYLSAACAALAAGSTTAFAPVSTESAARPETSLHMSEDGRRAFLGRIAGTTAAAVASSALLQGPVQPALAIGGLKKTNAYLASFGLPTVDSVPNGFSPLVEIWGKGKNRSPLLVQFSHPIDWVVTLPSQDVNGEDGTIQAGEYAKGDTATFYVYSDTGKVANIAEQPKSFFEKAIIKSISQKGDNIYQDFKITKVEPTKGEYKDQKYVLVDFKYTLLTGAGFEVDRVGVASITSVGDATEVLWTGSTRQRYKKTEPQLRAIAGSFRCFADGLDLSVGMQPDDDYM